MKILIVNPFGIGDVLFSTPLISRLKSAFPESSIGYICNIRAKGALESNPHIDKIFIFEKDEYRRLWKKTKIGCMKKFLAFLKDIKRNKFDLAIDLSLGLQYSLFLWLLGVKKRIGYNFRNRGRFLTWKIDIQGYQDKPIAEYYLDLLRFFNLDPRPLNLMMSVPEEDKIWAGKFLADCGFKKNDLIMGLIPAGGASWGRDFAYRHWPWQNYARLADRISGELKAKVIILGHASEADICGQVQNAAKTALVNACGRTTLKQFAALIARCGLIICNDGGPLHVAVSQNVKTISIFGPVDEKVYGPYSPEIRHITVTKNIACRPCYRHFKLPRCSWDRRCIKDIAIEEVFEICRKEIEK